MPKTATWDKWMQSASHTDANPSASPAVFSFFFPFGLRSSPLCHRLRGHVATLCQAKHSLQAMPMINPVILEFKPKTTFYNPKQAFTEQESNPFCWIQVKGPCTSPHLPRSKPGFYVGVLQAHREFPWTSYPTCLATDLGMIS